MKKVMIQKLEIFDENIPEESEKSESNGDKPLVLTQEIKSEINSLKSDEEKTLSPAVRKIVTENKIDIESVKG